MRNKEDSYKKIIGAGHYSSEEKFWLNKLSGPLVKSTFPYDFENFNDSTQRSRIEVEHFRFSGRVCEKLKKFSNESDIRLHIILVSGVIILLNKYSENRDIMIGTPVLRQDTEADFINTFLVIRQVVRNDETFKAFLLNVRQTIKEASENRNYPIETLPFLLDLPTHGDEFPLFDVSVLLQNIHDIRYLRGIQTSLTFSFLKTGKNIEGTVEYNALRYRESTIKGVISHYNHLFYQVLFDIEKQVGEIDILTENEKEQLLFGFNDTDAPYPGEKKIHQLFADQVGKSPDNTAVIAIDGGLFISYLELSKGADRLAGFLKTSGVKPGDIVGIMTDLPVYRLVGILGILKAEGAYLPIDSMYPGDRKRYMLKDSNAKVVITTRTLSEEVEQYGSLEVERIFVDDMEPPEHIPSEVSQPGDKQTADYGQKTVSPGNLAYVIYTSGTTGWPKGVLVEHRQAVNTLLYRKNEYRMGPGVTALQLFSYAFDGFVTSFFTPIISGAKVIVVNDDQLINIRMIKEVIVKQKVNHFIAIPALYGAIIDEADETELRWLKVVVLAGDKIPVKVLEKTRQKNRNIEIVNEYGVTEAGVMSTIYRHQERGAGVMIGRPIHNTKIIITGKNHRLQPIGVPGELCIAGTGVARGYLNRPELTAEKFIASSGQLSTLELSTRNLLYKTGDLARWLADGNIELLGRSDQQVKIRGFRIELSEIETRLSERPEIKEVVVAPFEDEKGDKHLCAYIVLRGKTSETKRETLDTAGLREYLSQRLPGYMFPSYFIPLKQLPLTVNGKIDRNALPEPELRWEKRVVSPRDEIEGKLVEIWTEELAVAQKIIGIDTDFFEVGGQSLKATVLVSRIHKEYDVHIPLKILFKTPTIRALSGYIRAAVKNRFTSIEPVEAKEYYPLTAAQNQFYIQQLISPDSTAFNVSEIVVFEEEPDMQRLESAFRALIREHESLRTSLLMVNDVPVQRIQPRVAFSVEYFDSVENRGGSRDEKPEERITADFIRPFDLSQAPLLRVGIIKNCKHTILMADMHHIISDAVSHEVLVRDFMALYLGEGSLPKKIHYKDFSGWQNSLEVKEKFKEQEAYWLKIFSRKVCELDMPIDFLRSGAVRQSREHVVGFELEGALAEKLDRVVAGKKVTLYMYLLAVYNVLLSKYCANEDIVVGTVVSGRRHADLQRVIGVFVNILAIRNYPDGEKTFADFLEETKATVLEAFDNQDYPFDMLLHKLNLTGNLNRNPLFDSVFQVQNVDVSREESGNFLKVSPYHNSNRAVNSRFEMVWEVTRGNGRVFVKIQYAEELYKNEKIETLYRHYVEIMKKVLENEQVLLIDIELSSGNREEVKQVENKIEFDF